MSSSRHRRGLAVWCPIPSGLVRTPLFRAHKHLACVVCCCCDGGLIDLLWSAACCWNVLIVRTWDLAVDKAVCLCCYLRSPHLSGSQWGHEEEWPIRSRAHKAVPHQWTTLGCSLVERVTSKSWGNRPTIIAASGLQELLLFWVQVYLYLAWGISKRI